jgi:hypothetical protein
VGGGKEQVVGASVKDKVEWCLVREAALGMDGVRPMHRTPDGKHYHYLNGQFISLAHFTLYY